MEKNKEIMNGCCIEGTPICVDFWPNIAKENMSSKFFFLSHLHRDHTYGLKSTWKHPIYTSHLNAKLAAANLKIGKSVLRPLELDEAHVLSSKSSPEVTLTVTLIEANHVPGAVMFLFQGSFGNILYSADMRYYRSLPSHPSLRSLIANHQIDVLYLDNTFCDPKFHFPTRDQALQHVLRIVREHPDDVIKVGLRTLGKEQVLEAIAKETGETVGLYPVRFQQNLLLDRPRVYQKTFDNARIHGVHLPMINNRNMERWNKVAPTIGIMLTAFTYGTHQEDLPHQSDARIFVVPYSDHSSFPELLQMVKSIRPCEIRPIVLPAKYGSTASKEDSKRRCDMSIFDDYLSPKRNGEGSTQNTSLLHTEHISLLSNDTDVSIRKYSISRRLRRTRRSQPGVVYQSPTKELGSLEDFDIPASYANNEDSPSSTPGSSAGVTSPSDFFQSSGKAESNSFLKRKELCSSLIKETTQLIQKSFKNQYGLAERKQLFALIEQLPELY